MTTKVSATEVFQLRGNTAPYATIAFKVRPGTGTDEDGNPCKDYDDVVVKSDHGELPIGGLVMAWKNCGRVETQRHLAQRLYRRLRACGYYAIS